MTNKKYTKDVINLRSLGPRELEDMVVGGVLIDAGGNERMVLEVLTQSFLPSASNMPEVAAQVWLTFKEAKENGWKLKDQEEPEE
jgi:hypothetical protein